MQSYRGLFIVTDSHILYVQLVLDSWVCGLYDHVIGFYDSVFLNSSSYNVSKRRKKTKKMQKLESQ
jgi:hypothetical protein